MMKTAATLTVALLPFTAAFTPSAFTARSTRLAAARRVAAVPATAVPTMVASAEPAGAPAGTKRRTLPPVLGGLKAGNKKLCVVTGASSGLGLSAAVELLEKDYFVICAVRDVNKMRSVAASEGMDESKYAIIECDLASFQSVRDFVFDLKAFKSSRPLDRLVCNAAVYLPKEPKAQYTKDGYEMSMGVNHLGHFLLCNLLIDDMAKSNDARMIIVGSITGNSNTVGGGLVYPRADVGQFQGWEQDGGEGKKVEMVDGKGFFGAKAYKDSKVCNMMTVSELHRRYHDKTGITFSSLYPGCIAETALFREKRAWFRKGFPLFMKYVTGGYVSQEEAGERLAQVVDDPICKKSGVYWSWNGGAKQVGVYDPSKKQVVGAGGAGGEIFENDQSTQVTDQPKAEKMFELSSTLCGVEWPAF